MMADAMGQVAVACTLLFALWTAAAAAHGVDTEACSAALAAPHYWTSGGEADRWLDRSAEHTPSRLVGTQLAQSVIYSNQHPASCATARFLILGPWWGGIGGRISFMAAALGVAIAEGRVLLLDFSDDPWLQGAICPGRMQTYDTCWFEPLSSCSLADVYGQDTFSRAQRGDADLAHVAQQRAAIQALNTTRFDFRTVPAHHGWDNGAPPVLQPLHDGILAGRSRTPGAEYLLEGIQWWRTQGTAYIVRPNARLLAAIAARSAAIFPQRTIPRGTVSVHVRHGDKGVETRLVADQVYSDAVAGLLRDHPHLQRRIFLSTEDPATVRHFLGLTFLREVLYVNVTRNNLGGVAPEKVPEPTEEFVDSMVNLALALKCDAFMCMLSSRWCDLINRLRLTVRCKAHRPLLSAQHLLSQAKATQALFVLRPHAAAATAAAALSGVTGPAGGARASAAETVTDPSR